jgi:hypothetical protein
MRGPEQGVLRLGEIDFLAAETLLERLGLRLVMLPPGCPIPGSFWGEPEAGVIGPFVYARPDTPVHSLLHEASHLLVAPASRRARIHTDASDCLLEEDATCYLQILLADALPGVGRERMLADMDAWGYRFRLGSARAWFEHDAEDARAHLLRWALIDAEGALLGPRS